MAFDNQGVLIPTNSVKIYGPTEVIPRTMKNEHTMQPCGCVKGYFQSIGVSGVEDYVANITLSNRSVDGLTFTYNADFPITPAIGNYVFQKESSLRSWITSLDIPNKTLTFEQPILEEGARVYSRGNYTDFTIPDWGHLTMCLWGLAINVLEKDENNVLETDPCEDFIELSVVDEYDMFKMDEVCQALFGVDASGAEPYLLAYGFEQNREYGHWTKYYDESWIVNINGSYVRTPDGSPGELMAGLVLRLSIFTTEVEIHKYHTYLDYYMTVRD